MKSHPRSSSRRLAAPLALLILLGLTVGSYSRPVPANLGNGLDKLIESNLILKGRLAAPASTAEAQPNGTTTVAGKPISTFDGYATQEAANYAKGAMVDAVSDRFLVDIVLSGKLAFADVKKSLTKSLRLSR